MTVRTVVLVLLSIFAAIFLILNWQGITAPVPVNLLFKSTEAPLGLILLIVLGVLWCVGIVWALMQQASTLVEIRRAYKEASANKNLADHAEVSRIEQVKTAMQGEFQAFETKILACVQKTQDTTEKSTVDTQARLLALEKAVARFEKTVEKMADKVGVVPVVEEAPVPQKKGFFGFLSSSVDNKPEEVKPIIAPEPEKISAEVTQATVPETQTTTPAETPDTKDEQPKQGFFKKMFSA